jgi:hypothetical protein
MARGRAAGGLNRLLIHSVGDDTGIRHYLPAVRRFLGYVGSLDLPFTNFLDIDAALSDFLDFMFYEDAGSFNDASFAVSGIGYLEPRLRGHLPEAWRSLASWKRLAPLGEGAPVPWETLLVMGDDMNRLGRVECGLMLETAMDAWLRTQDLAMLLVGDVSFTTDSQGRRIASLALGVPERGEATKTGFRQGVVIDHYYVADRLYEHCQGRSAECPLFVTSVRVYTDTWRKVRAARGLSYVGPPHSVRHSGPSRDHFLGLRGLDEIMKRGRWRGPASVLRYSKSHVYVSQLARQPGELRALGEKLALKWGDRYSA